MLHRDRSTPSSCGYAYEVGDEVKARARRIRLHPFIHQACLAVGVEIEHHATSKRGDVSQK